jgi:hypothetical protein
MHLRGGGGWTAAPRIVVLALGGLALAASVALAQRGGFRPRQLPLMTAESYDGAFQFCRVAYRNNRGGDGGGWSTDFPDADLNLSTRLGELTKTPISRDPRTGDPNHVIVQLTDPLLSRCPFTMMFEVGSFFIDEVEAEHLRNYLVKGGFLWVDDFWGNYAWDIWESQIRKALPSGTYPIVDLTLDHPLFRQVFVVPRIPQIPSINYWLGSGGDTSERGPDSRPPHIRGISDERGRLMVLMTHNTDFGDSWEREGVSNEYFLTFSVDGYRFAVNTLVYAMTH